LVDECDKRPSATASVGFRLALARASRPWRIHRLPFLSSCLLQQAIDDLAHLHQQFAIVG
jgi:hypothetical protein